MLPFYLPMCREGKSGRRSFLFVAFEWWMERQKHRVLEEGRTGPSHLVDFGEVESPWTDNMWWRASWMNKTSMTPQKEALIYKFFLICTVRILEEIIVKTYRVQQFCTIPTGCLYFYIGFWEEIDFKMGH